MTQMQRLEGIIDWIKKSNEKEIFGIEIDSNNFSF